MKAVERIPIRTFAGLHTDLDATVSAVVSAAKRLNELGNITLAYKPPGKGELSAGSFRKGEAQQKKLEEAVLERNLVALNAQTGKLTLRGSILRTS
jgi:hypothetical protein